MRLFEVKEIEVRFRQREIEPDTLVQLKDSIKSKGLLHAPVVAVDSTGQAVLVCGMHRKLAMESIHEDGQNFRYNGEIIPKGKIPCVLVSELGPADLLEAELEENIIRAPIPWQDRMRAIAAIHELRKGENPKQTFSDTAQEIQAKTDPSRIASGRAKVAVRNAVILAAHLDNPSISKARNATEALGLVYKEQEAAIQAELIRRRASSAPPPVTAILGDMTVVLPSLQPEQFDLIIADLPYGIGANTGGFRQRSVVHHNYEDTPDEALRLLNCILADGFRVAKSRANLFVFGDIDMFPHFKRASMAMGWKPFRTPIVWRKSNEGLAPWGREGPRRTYELIFFATKGNRGLHQSPTDILNFPRVGREERDYGPEKPIPLLKKLVEVASMPGDHVLDPCCGSGLTLAACRELRRRALGIEIDEFAFNLATGKTVSETDEEDADASVA